jgi:hypothetical protein
MCFIVKTELARNSQDIETHKVDLAETHKVELQQDLLDQGEELAKDLDKCGTKAKSHVRDMGIKQRPRAKKILQFMKKEKWTFRADIEVEYKMPESSSAVAKVLKCVRYCKHSLA